MPIARGCVDPAACCFVEVGWRLAFRHWGQGFTTEAAQEAIRVGFGSLGLEEIIAFTPLGNLRSRAVMERLGMRESGTFEHPQVPEGNRLRTHGLYRLSHQAYAVGGRSAHR
jgi:RimJ/RimL family protein N-acetyltransferase